MATSRGKSEVRSFMAALPAAIEEKLLPGAGRAGGKVIAAEASQRARSPLVAENVQVRTKHEPHRIVVKVSVKPGFAASVGNWLEWGTSPHFISVDDSQRGGRSVGRINKLDRAARDAGQIGAKESLVIGGTFVGATVFHPGARPEPFLRPALDAKIGDAVAAAQAYINARIGKAGIAAAAEGDDA